MTDTYARLNFGPHWEMNNANLIDLIDLVPDDKLDWSPAPGEWSIKVITTHIILARSRHIVDPGANAARISATVADCQTKDGLQRQLRVSWETVASLLKDQARLDALYGPPEGDPMYLDPEVYDGHYVAYHRMAHDLHHRSTIIGHMAQLGISLEGHRVRPL
jgi:hypothetical protein